MGKSLTGKELGQGISQRKDGRYQARFTNRFGKRQTIYGKTCGLKSGWIPVKITAVTVAGRITECRIIVSETVWDGVNLADLI